MPHHGQVIGWPQATTLPAYTVWLDAGIYYAMNNTTGAIEFQGPDPAVVVQACLTAGGAGCVVGLREANYVALTGVAATANNQSIYGMGRGTYWDATALLTGVHAFTIDGFTGCELRHFAIETDAGGGLVNHCVFINDGADDFHLIELTIVDSDSDGIHVEGTTITQGHIHRCHIEGADGAGILVDMDAANFMYRLHLEDCDILACGVRGINFAASGGNWYCEIVNNVVAGCTGSGIYLEDGNYSMIRGNVVTDSSLYGIQVHGSQYAHIIGNILLYNAFNGIEVANDSDRSSVVGNVCYENAAGISLSSTFGCTVSGNTCVRNNSHGIQLEPGSQSNTVTGNSCVENNQHGIYLTSADFCTVVGNTCNENDFLNTGSFDGILLDTCDRVLVMGNQCQDNDRWGIRVIDDSNWCKISMNYTNGNTAGSIEVNGAACDGNEVVFNTVEEGAPVDTGTLTRASGNFDPSANAYIAVIGADPW